MRTGMMIAGAIAWMASLAVACSSGPGAVGAPCEIDEDCEGELVCDEHDGQGSCQVAHDHGSGTEAASTGDPHDTDTDHAHDGDMDTGHADDPGTETGPDHGGTDTGSGSGEATTGGPSAACEAFCGCMAANCSEYAAYPHADEAACLEGCAGLPDPELTCFAGFCEDAAVEPNAGLKEHWCEHAWGELGTDEC